MRFLVDLQDIRGLSGRGREGIVRFEFNSFLSSFIFLLSWKLSLSLSHPRICLWVCRLGSWQSKSQGEEELSGDCVYYVCVLCVRVGRTWDVERGSGYG